MKDRDIAAEPKSGRRPVPARHPAAVAVLRPGALAGREYDGERRLMIAVLEDAVDVYRKQAGARDARRQQLFEDAEEWIESHRSLVDLLVREHLRRARHRRRVPAARAARDRKQQAHDVARAGGPAPIRRSTSRAARGERVLTTGDAVRRRPSALPDAAASGYSPPRAAPAAVDCPGCGAPLVRKPGGRCPACGADGRRPRPGGARSRGADREGGRGRRHGPRAGRVRA